MQRLTIMRSSGDSDALLAAKREHIDPIMEQRGAELGNVFHVAARGPDGLIVANLWESAEASERAFNDPEVQRARAAMADSGAAAGPPEVTHYEVVDYQQSTRT